MPYVYENHRCTVLGKKKLPMARMHLAAQQRREQLPQTRRMTKYFSLCCLLRLSSDWKNRPESYELGYLELSIRRYDCHITTFELSDVEAIHNRGYRRIVSHSDRSQNSGFIFTLYFRSESLSPLLLKIWCPTILCPT